MGGAFVRLLPGFALRLSGLRRERSAPSLRAAIVFRSAGEQLYLFLKRFELGFRARRPLRYYFAASFERPLSAPRGDEVTYARYRDAHFAQRPYRADIKQILLGEYAPSDAVAR